MSLVVLLDSGPLGLVTNPTGSPLAVQCSEWLDGLVARRVSVVVSEIADYEVRRELLRAGKARGLRRLDAIAAAAIYAPLATETMRQAAEFWAQARNQGRPTADPKELDADVILAAQAALIGRGGDQPVIATTNVGHLSRFVDARRWQDIP